MRTPPLDPLGHLDRVPWQELHHAYGTAQDVPAQLRALRSGDPLERDAAESQLYGNVYHQGTRWQVSCHVVPVLVGFADDPATPDRAAVIDLLSAVALGDRDDRDLPLRPDELFGPAEAISPQQLAKAVERLYDPDSGWDDPESIDLLDLAAQRWDADAFRAAAGFTGEFRRWLADDDPGIAARAAALLAWFDPTGPTLAELIAVPADEPHAMARASANLTLAHLPVTVADSGRVDACLAGQLTESSPEVRVTAAVALAYRAGGGAPAKAREVLAWARDVALADLIDGWERPLNGFVALARQRAEPASAR
jgi:hypothetical protein